MKYSIILVVRNIIQGFTEFELYLKCYEKGIKIDYTLKYMPT